MKKFLVMLTFCAFGLSANASSLLTSNIEANPIVDNSEVTAAPLSTFTAYGRAVITFYPNGNVKKIRCKKPHNVVCWTVVQTTNEHNVYENGSATPTHTFINATYVVSTVAGDTVIDF